MEVQSQFIEMFGNPVTNPKGWKTSKIKDVAPESPSKESVDGRVWLLNLDMIESNTGKVIEKVYEDSENALSVQPFDEGNVLFSKLRPYLNKVVIPDEPGLATTELVPLRPKGDILNKIFLSHLLRGDQFVNFANDIAGGTKMPRMPLSELRKFECILPPMEEQMKFVAIAELADKSKFVGFKSRFIEMFGVPANSTKGKRGEEVFTFSSGKANTKSNLDPSFQYNCYGGNGITGKSKDYLLKDKTIVIGRVGEYCGCVHKTTDYCWITDNAIYLKTYSDLYRFEFIYHMFTMMDFHRFASETGQPKITQAPLLSCHYPLPSLEQQNKFVAIAEQADKSKFELRKSIEAIDQVIKSLINN